MRIAVLGRTRFLLDTIHAVRSAGHEVSLIGTCQESPDDGVTIADFEKTARQIGCSFFADHRINSDEILSLLSAACADVALSVNWLTVFQTNAVGAFRFGVLNAHFGELPRYRGNACPNWAIIAGEKRIGLCIHFMKPGELDSGDILVQDAYPLTDSTTVGEFYAFAHRRVPEMFVEAVNKLANEKFEAVSQSQNPSHALRCYPRIPSDSLIHWELTPTKLSALIRASSEPLGGAYTYWNGEKLVVWRAKVGSHACPNHTMLGQVLWRDPQSGEVAVAASDGVLILQEVSMEGKPRVPAAQVLTELTTWFQANPVSVRPGRKVVRRAFSPSRSYHYQRRVRKIVF